MYQFIETIQILDGEILLLEYHNRRMNETIRHFLGNNKPIDLKQYINSHNLTGEIKCRIVYDNNIVDVSYTPYTMRSIQSLKLVQNDEIDYSYKSADRSRLSLLAAQKGEADEILIVRQGLLTDTSFSNIALFDGNEWSTPGHPLLKGTQRAYLIDQGLLHEKDIRAEDLYHYQKLSLINAMIDLGKIEIPIAYIK